MKENKIKIVAVGMGGRGSWGVRELSKHRDFELTAIVDIIPERMDIVAAEYELGEIAKFASLKECLNSVPADAVAIFTPDGAHVDLVELALEAGKYVFVEKPLDISEERLERIIEADRKAGGKTFVGLNLRFTPVYTMVHELVAEGVVGKVLNIQADEFYSGGRTYFLRWNRLESIGGGLWVTKACHDFDLLYWMAGAEPTTVYASGSLDYYKPRADVAQTCRDCHLNGMCPDRYEAWVGRGSLADRLNIASEKATGNRRDLCLFNSDKDTLDHGIATITFSNNVVASYALTVVTGMDNRLMRIGGTKGTIEADVGAAKITIRRRYPKGFEEIDLSSAIKGGHGGGDERIFHQFASFVHGSSSQVVRPAEAAMGVRIGLAARESTKGKRIVEF